jgi:hypothetical protein
MAGARFKKMLVNRAAYLLGVAISGLHPVFFCLTQGIFPSKKSLEVEPIGASDREFEGERQTEAWHSKYQAIQKMPQEGSNQPNGI